MGGLMAFESETKASLVRIFYLTVKVNTAAGCGLTARFHRQFCVEALLVSEDRRDRERLSVLHEANGHVLVLRLPVDVEAIPFLGVADVVDAHVVMRAPEERRLSELLARAED